MLDFTFVQVTTRSQLCTRHFLTFEYNQLVLLFFCHSGPTTSSKGPHVNCGHWGVCSLLELLDQNGSNQNIEDVIIVITAVATQQNLLHQHWYWRKKKLQKNCNCFQSFLQKVSPYHVYLLYLSSGNLTASVLIHY